MFLGETPLTRVTVNVLITLGSERLYSDLSRKYRNRDPSETVNVIRLEKSGGCVNRSEEYMKALRHAQVREYFFGHGDNTLAPSSQTCDFGDLHIFQIVEGMWVWGSCSVGDDVNSGLQVMKERCIAPATTTNTTPATCLWRVYTRVLRQRPRCKTPCWQSRLLRPRIRRM